MAWNAYDQANVLMLDLDGGRDEVVVLPYRLSKNVERPASEAWLTVTCFRNKMKLSRGDTSVFDA